MVFVVVCDVKVSLFLLADGGIKKYCDIKWQCNVHYNNLKKNDKMFEV